MAEDQGQWERWLGIGATIIAPATVLTALLFYFGYVSSRAQYAYFGVDVDTIGLSTQAYVMRSPQPLLVPVLLLTILGIAGLLAHQAIRRRIARTPPGARGAEEYRRHRGLARRGVIVGLVILGAGLLLLVLYPYLREWPLYNLVTPLVLAIGTSVVAYASKIQTLLSAPPGATRAGEDAAPRSAAREQADHSIRVLRGAASVLVFVVVVANIFWATATIAQWSGRGLAHYDATHLDRLPSVILDTQERLYLRSPGVEETALPVFGRQSFRYRYRHLRLLIQGDNRMFLVPDKWSASDSTLVVPLDATVRVQFQFRNEQP